MIIPLLITFLIGAASGVTAQVIADRIKPPDMTIVCVATHKDAKPECNRVKPEEKKR